MESAQPLFFDLQLKTLEMKINDFLKSMENSVIQYIVFDFRSVKPGFIKHVILV